jgi:23S rRNA (adenine2030-N6)-methyltransferase
MPRFLSTIHRKWNVGILMLWYPILVSGAHHAMLAALASAFPDALRHELRFPAAREGHRMLGSGLFIVNPPFGIVAETVRLTAQFAALSGTAT